MKKVLLTTSGKNKKLRHLKQGFSLVEVLLAIAMLGIITTVVFGAIFYAHESNAIVTNRNRALALAQEGLDATQAIRDEDFANLIDGTYGLSSASNQWAFSGSSDTVDIYTREIEISTIDATTKQILSRITWTQNSGRSGQIELVTYLSNIYRSIGMVPLPGWGTPLLDGSLDLSGTDDATRVRVVGNYAFVMRTGGTQTFTVVDISDTTLPTYSNSLSLSGNPQDLEFDGNYAYVPTDDNVLEFQIIDVSTPATPSVIGTLDLADKTDGKSIKVVGNYAYFGRLKSNKSAEFSIIDITSKIVPTLSSDLEISGDVLSIEATGSYVILGTNDKDNEIQVIDVSIPASPTNVYTLDLPGNNSVNDFAIFGNYLFVGANDGIVYIYDITNPLSFSSISTYNAGNSVLSLDLNSAGDFLFLASFQSGSEFQVVDTSIIGSPVIYGSYSDSGILYLDYDDTLDRNVLVESDNALEFSILKPQ